MLKLVWAYPWIRMMRLMLLTQEAGFILFAQVLSLNTFASRLSSCLWNS